MQPAMERRPGNHLVRYPLKEPQALPKQLQIDPGQTYAADSVRFADIPVHAYAADLEVESCLLYTSDAADEE